MNNLGNRSYRKERELFSLVLVREAAWDSGYQITVDRRHTQTYHLTADTTMAGRCSSVASYYKHLKVLLANILSSTQAHRATRH